MRQCWGGGLFRQTADGWHVEALTLDWPRQTLLLEKPGTGIYDLQTALDATALGIESEVRTFGFSPSGENMLLATNDSSRLWKRESRQIG